ncbi:MAG TPA: tetratricopeptide repeat protein [Polyangiaceae bacterium]|nr:tetratricopeptide repeat protein [Polyangiaceae bacterium]
MSPRSGPGSAATEPLAAAKAKALAEPGGSQHEELQIRRLQQVARSRPQQAEAWVELGKAWVIEARRSSDPGFYWNAEACAELALAIDGDSRPALNLRGLVLLNGHRFRESEALTRSILDRDSDDAVAWGTLSDARLELGDLEGASEAAERMLSIKPNLPSYSRLSYLRWLRGDEAGALESARLAIDAGGGARGTEALAWVLVQTAQLFWQRGDYPGARAGFEQALAVMPEYPPACVGLGKLALAEQQATRAVTWLKLAFSHSALAETAWLLSDALRLTGDSAAAADWLSKAEALGQHDPRTLSLLYSVQNRNAARALELAEHELEVRADIYTLDALAWAQFRLGRYSEARQSIDRARRWGTRDARLLFHQGAIYRAVGELARGREWIATALRLNPYFDVTEAAEARALLGRAPS